MTAWMAGIWILRSFIAIAQRPKHGRAALGEVRMCGDQGKDLSNRINQSLRRVLQAPVSKQLVIGGIRMVDKPLANADDFGGRKDRRALQLSNEFRSLPVGGCW